MQDGGHGDHLGFPIGTILGTFDLQATLILPIKFRVNWLTGAGEVVFLSKLLTLHKGQHTRDD